MPARRKRKTRRSYSFQKIFLILLASVIFLIWFVLRKGIWQKNSTLTIVSAGENNVCVHVFNEERREWYLVVIPGTTEVDVTNSLGRWPLSSLWDLGKNEGWGGRLLRDTVTKNFSFPILTWSDQGLCQIVDNRLWSFVGGVVATRQTNLSWRDRIKLIVFRLRLKDIDQYRYQLEETSFLVKKVLKSGQSGFQLTKIFPDQLLPIFTLVSGSPVVVINYEELPSESVVKTVEVMGGRVISLRKRASVAVGGQNDCLVQAKDRLTGFLIAHVFSCEFSEKNESLDAEVSINFGRAFNKRF